MSDLPNSSNMRLPELLDFALERGIFMHTGYATLSQLRHISGYGDLGSDANRTLDYFKLQDKLSITQTPDKNQGVEISKLVNLWKLQQSLLQGNDFDDFIVCSYNHIDNRPVLEIHPGRTRLCFHNVYNKPIPVLILNYTKPNYLKPPFDVELLTKENIATWPWPDQEWRVTPDWDISLDSEKKYLLVQPNDNEQWHWPALEGNITFQICTKDGILTDITANTRPFMEYRNWQWHMVI